MWYYRPGPKLLLFTYNELLRSSLYFFFIYFSFQNVFFYLGWSDDTSFTSNSYLTALTKTKVIKQIDELKDGWMDR